MLFNLAWKQKPNPHSLDDLIAWLETKDPNEQYDFCSVNGCLIAQWVKHCDPRAHHPQDRDGSTYIVHGVEENFRYLYQIAGRPINGTYTIGNALLKARTLTGKCYA